MKYFIATIIACVAIVIGAGLYMVGSPQQERLRRFDERRVQDLSVTQSNLIGYWQAKNDLPEKLADLTDATRGVSVLVDPVTNVEYGYKKISNTKFQLCADFATSVTSTLPLEKGMAYPEYAPYGVLGVDNWNHAVGTVCFDRTIDPDFFKTTPLPTVKD